MPKKTFYNLPRHKQKNILDICKKHFEDRPLSEVKVSHIVEELNMARGSFYQYFDDLQECYFTVLNRETAEIHLLFGKTLALWHNDVFTALTHYGTTLAAELYSPSRYGLYRNRFLHWTPMIEEAWHTYLRGQSMQETGATADNAPNQHAADKPHTDRNASAEEIMQFIKAVTHALVRRMFLENWKQDDFLHHYNLQMHWVQNGLKSANPSRFFAK